jgi:group I intron endonuclease
MLRQYEPTKKAWLYITTNKINGKKYIGQTTSTKKNYVGSGQAIMAAIKKYGKENFTREIVYEGTWEEVDLLEAMYIETYDAINSDDFYNLKEGGHHGKHNNPETSKRMSDARSGKTYEEIYGEDGAKTQRALRSKLYSGSGNPFFNKSHSDETIDRIRTKRAHQVITDESNKKRSETNATLPKFQCINCGRWLFKRHIVQYHGDKCKERKI